MRGALVRQQFIDCYAKDLCQCTQFNIRHKTLSALNALDRIFIDIYTGQLEAVSERSLRNGWFHCFSEHGYFLTT